MDIEILKKKLRSFAEERDWEQFHSPKNLSMALIAEAAELVEKFQWLTEDQSFKLDDQLHSDVRDELGDIFIYLVRISDRLGIDILEAAFDKHRKNEKKYPVDKARGNCKKYDKL